MDKAKKTIEKTYDEFTARHHAMLFAWIAKEIINKFGKEGEKAIEEAVIVYGKQRGKRMAMRTERDGLDINAINYLVYGEWEVNDSEMDLRISSDNLGINMRSYKCPWYDEWVKNDMVAYGKYYCNYIDKALVSGYCEGIKLDVLCTKVEDALYCDFIFIGETMDDADKQIMNMRKEAIGSKSKMKWDYHTGHLYKTLKDIIISRFYDDGEKAINIALDEFKKAFGKNLYDRVVKFETTDFSILPNEK